jgi:hypothetical protein
MGIYPDHGVEYHIVLKNNKRYVIAGTKSTDDRLLKSNYLATRYDNWMNLCRSQCIPLQDLHEFDVELEEIEKQKLEKLLNEHDKDVLTHGWYDVCSVWDTYGDPPCCGDNSKVSGYYATLQNGNEIKVGSKETLDESDTLILNGILNVYDNQVVSHGWVCKN